MTAILGIDIGGSGIKGAPVDLETGELTKERFRIVTPKKSTPKNCADVVAEIVDHFADDLPADSPIGVTIPAPVVHGVVPFIANLDQKWAGTNANELFTERLQRPVYLVNDADGAGLAEVKYGAAKDRDGLIIMTTLGTGIGTAFIYNGVLVPNSELGHIEIEGKVAETQASAGVKSKKHLSYKVWARRLQKYYSKLEMLFTPDLFIVGGGVSKSSEKFIPLLELNAPIIPAQLLNTAGIVGAAAVAAGHTISNATSSSRDADVAER